MNVESNYKQHSLLDREHSDKIEISYEDQIILDSINDIIEQRSNSDLESQTIISVDETESFYQVPKLKRNTVNNYTSYFTKAQSWIGFVEDIGENDFKAKLIDKNSPDTYEIATFDQDEVSPGDNKLLTRGAVFYWSVGYENNKGQVSKQSLIRFKRSIDFTIDDIDSISDESSALLNNINWD